MTISTKLDEKLEGVDNLRAWKYGVMLTLEENSIWKSSLKRTSQNLKKMRTLVTWYSTLATNVILRQRIIYCIGEGTSSYKLSRSSMEMIAYTRG